MINSYFIGRIGKDGAKVIEGKNGNFMTMDVATDIYSQGENKAMWVRVRSNMPAHMGKLVQHLTKGKMIEVAGQQIEPSAWNGKDGNPHAQVVILASFIKFVPFGKKQGGQDSEQEQNAPENNVPDANAGMPFKAPDDKADDLPF